MSDEAAAEAKARASTLAANGALALVACGLAFASYALFDADRAARVPAQQFAERYTMPLRNPDTVSSLRFAPSGDFAGDLVADATLHDVASPVRLTDLEPAVRDAWIDSVQSQDAQLESACGVMLDALAARPGWPYHAILLGQLVYTREAQSLSPDLVAKYRRWAEPLNAGARSAPADAQLWQVLALAYLQTWPDLAHAHANEAANVFRNAFASPEFVRAAFIPATRTIGVDAAVANLPDVPKSLWSAYQLLASSGDVRSAWRVHQRWDQVEWRQRDIDLRALEQIATRRDAGVISRACRAWAAAHSVWDYDTPAARAQAARVLDLWPVSDSGRWPNDPRMDMINYFLAGRSESIDGAILARAAGPIAGVPLSRQAQLHVLASDITSAESFARSTESFGTLEWTPYIIELSRYWLRKGDREKALAALDAVAPAARSECEAGIAQREASAQFVAAALPRVGLQWIGRASVPLCLAKRSAVKVTFSLVSGDAVIVDYGWDGARTGSMLLTQGDHPAEVVLPPLAGQRTVTLRTSSQPDTTSITTEVEAES